MNKNKEEKRIGQWDNKFPFAELDSAIQSSSANLRDFNYAKPEFTLSKVNFFLKLSPGGFHAEKLTVRRIHAKPSLSPLSHQVS